LGATYATYTMVFGDEEDARQLVITQGQLSAGRVCVDFWECALLLLMVLMEW